MTIVRAVRRIPSSLRIRLLFGNFKAQTGWSLFAIEAGIAALLANTSHAPSDNEAGEAVAMAVLGGVWAFMNFTVLWLGVRTGHTQLRLLRHGVETKGRLVEYREIEGEGGSDHKWTFAYAAEDAQHEVEFTTDFYEPHLRDQAWEPMLYMPGKPELSTTLDNLPGHPRIDEYGQVVAQQRSVWPVLILPVLTIVAIGIFVYGLVV